MLRSQRGPLHGLYKCDTIHENDSWALGNPAETFTTAILTPRTSVFSLSKVPILHGRGSLPEHLLPLCLAL
jgi:hypothetical protein